MGHFQAFLDNYEPAPELNAVIDEVKPKVVKRKARDPNAPKQPLSAYTIYFAENRNVVAKEHPEMTPPLVMKEVSRLWKETSPEDRTVLFQLTQHYVAEALKSKTKYQKELAAYTFGNVEANADEAEGMVNAFSANTEDQAVVELPSGSDSGSSDEDSSEDESDDNESVTLVPEPIVLAPVVPSTSKKLKKSTSDAAKKTPKLNENIAVNVLTPPLTAVPAVKKAKISKAALAFAPVNQTSLVIPVVPETSTPISVEHKKKKQKKIAA